jgi:rSAM/selenodomain-associated transferase 1
LKQLVLFARMPRLGAGKRRLAAAIGDLAALGFERLQLRNNLRRLKRPHWRCRLALAPDRARLAERGWRVGPQGRGDLGRRMGRIFRTLPPGPVVLVGNDIPALRPHHVAAAFRALGSADAVFGPAEDGGYWLVGLSARARNRGLFRRVRWSGPHALADTLANAPGLRVRLVETLWDVDDLDDWRRFKALV